MSSVFHRVEVPSFTLPSPSRLWNDETVSVEVMTSLGNWDNININSYQLDLVVLKLPSWWLHIMMFYGQCTPLSPKTPWLPRYLGCVRVQIFSLSVHSHQYTEYTVWLSNTTWHAIMLIISRVFLSPVMSHQAHQKVRTHIRPVTDSIPGGDMKKKTLNQ